MSTSGVASPGQNRHPSTTVHTAGADRAYRRAWWSLALYPVSFVAAFVIGEGLYSAMGGDSGHVAWWKPLVAATPAILVFVVPGVLAMRFGRSAQRQGRADGRNPAMIGAVVGLGFVALNLASLVLMVLFG
jgi:hypothetical protein